MKHSPKWRGPVIGINKQGYPTPVFFDAHTAINVKSKSGGIVVTGSPGSGKSQLGMNLAIMSAISGKKTVYLDPKNDALGMVNLAGELGGKVEVWDLNDGQQNGAMDPYIMESDPRQKIAKAYSLVEILVGGLSDEQMTLLYPIMSDIANTDDPSLTALVTKLLRSDKPMIEALGTKLQAVEGSNPISGLIFKRGREKPKMKHINDGLTIITTMGLRLPEYGSDPKHYRAEERLGLGIMYLITDFILSVMKDQDTRLDPKTVVIDEAWAVVNNSAGYATIESLLRLGRSLNTATILMTQNVSDLKSVNGEDKLMNSAVTQFAFRCEDTDEAKRLCKTLGISFDAFGEIFANLDSGWCIMKDYLNRVSMIYILQQNDRWVRAFETNPLKKAQNKRQEMEKLLAQQKAEQTGLNVSN